MTTKEDFIQRPAQNGKILPNGKFMFYLKIFHNFYNVLFSFVSWFVYVGIFKYLYIQTKNYLFYFFYKVGVFLLEIYISIFIMEVIRFFILRFLVKKRRTIYVIIMMIIITVLFYLMMKSNKAIDNFVELTIDNLSRK